MSELVLGIESSCDDTSVAVVDPEGHVLSSVIADQAKIHAQYGGVYPELASRAHLESILPAIEESMQAAGISPKDIEAIGVTRGPGLIGSLLVGLNTAASLGLAWNLPVVGVNHLRGHLRSADLEQKRVTYPAVVFLVSGGHTFLAHMEDATTIRLLGATRDDSAGEAYDKVGRMLGLGYPGGPVVDRKAKEGTASIPFPRPMLDRGLDFSFAGIKTAVSVYLQKTENPVVEDVAASFVEAVMEVFITKCRRALKKERVASLVVVGGVAASPQLRAEAQKLCDEAGVDLCLPPLRWATDNAAMIGLATWDYLKLSMYPRPVPEVRLGFSEF